MSENQEIVFISYSHDSDEHKDQCFAFKVQLHTDGIECTIDQDTENPPEGWPLWCERQIKKAQYVLIICTEDYCKRFEHNEESGKGKGGKWEGSIIRTFLYDSETNNEKFIPVYFNEENKQHIPTILKGYTSYHITNNKPDEYRKLYRFLTNQKGKIIPPKGKVKLLKSEEPEPLFGDMNPLDTESDSTNQSTIIKNEPVRFSFEDLREIVASLHETIITNHPTSESLFDKSIIDIKKKNEINGMGEDYFRTMIEDDSYSRRIQDFLSHPANEEINVLYHEVVDELRRKISVIRKDFDNFELIINGIYNAVIDGSENSLKGKKKVLGVLLSYMYLNCDIGHKHDSPL